jgi:hypothetical protein
MSNPDAALREDCVLEKETRRLIVMQDDGQVSDRHSIRPHSKYSDCKVINCKGKGKGKGKVLPVL